MKQLGGHRSSSAQNTNANDSSSILRAPMLVNYGERLYHKGLKMKEEQSRLLNEVRAQQEQVTRNCSFHPQINEISRIIAHNPNREQGVKAEDALIRFGQLAREKLEVKRSELLFKEL